MSEKYHFRAVIQDAGSGGAFVCVPFDVEQAFGKKRVKIKALIAGEPYRGSLVRMGTEQHLLLVLKEIRLKIGKTFGDEIAVEIEEDFKPRQVSVPADLQAALEAHPQAQAFFEKLAYSHQREYVGYVEEAKPTETRQKRIAKTIELLAQSRKEV